MYLDELRNQINDIDDKIVELFVERMKVASEIAGAKAEKNLPGYAQRKCCAAENHGKGRGRIRALCQYSLSHHV